VPGVEDVELAAGQPVVQELGVGRRHRAADDQAAQPPRMRGRGEQGGGGADVVTVLALRETDRQPVDDPELHLDGRVQPGGHPAMVRPGGPCSYPPLDSASGQSPAWQRAARRTT